MNAGLAIYNVAIAGFAWYVYTQTHSMVWPIILLCVFTHWRLR